MANQIRPKTGQVKMKGVADIVFCFDCTYSMSEIIESVKNNVDKLIDGFETLTDLDWRARAMGYRDFEVDEEYLINDKPFVDNDVDALKAQIASIEAKEYTGGDDPESTLDAIWYAACKSDWRSNCHKIVVVFTDEASKGVNEKTIADIPAADADIDVLAQELNVNHIKLFLWGKKDPLYDILQKIPRADIVQLEDPENDFKNMEFDKVMEQMGKTISELASSGGIE